MGTRAAAFTAKIRNLQEYHTRIVSNVFQAPSGTDICATLKYFSQLLLGVLRDVPGIPIDLIRNHDKDHIRTSLFPSLDYKNLYYVIVQLLEILPQIQTGMQIVGQTILHTLGCLVPFLEHEYMDSLPYIVASAMAVLPAILHKELLDMLCYNLLPFTIDEDSNSENLNYANMSIPSIIMIVLNYADNPSYHTQLLECLMRLKHNVAKDLLCVIAYGTAKARCAAVELLFLYWPHLNPSALDRKSLSEKHVSWTPLTCQYENCQNTLSNEAVKMCIDHTIVIGSAERPPPMLICIECTDLIYRGKSRDTLLNILLPMEDISYNCENKSCKSPHSQKIAVAACFSIECTNYNCNKPVRYCSQCNEEKHSDKESSNHIFHSSIPCPWDMDSETQTYLVEAIVSLLKEAQPDKPSKDSERHSRIGFQVSDDNQETTIEERQLLSRYGVWLLVGLCSPNQTIPEEKLGRMLSMLCQWFHYTACLPDDQASSALERLKGECIHGWLMKIIKTHFNVFTSCLLPHPLDYARLGGHWESWPSQTNQIKEGFKRLLCLVPYDIITADVWGHIMPYWMECFRHDVPEEELAELKILLSKVLDPDLSPLGLQPKQMYQFISIRFENTTAPIQEQALYWLQILTMLEVPVPLNLLNTMFSTGVKSLSNPNLENICSVSKVYPDPGSNVLNKSGTRTHITENIAVNDQEINLSCYILMLDILVKQFELQEVNSHKGLESKEAVLVLKLILDILHAPWVGTHTCRELDNIDLNEGEVQQCLYCEMCAIWYQLTLLIIEYFCPAMEVTMADFPGEVTSAARNVSAHEKLEKTDSNVSTKDVSKPIQTNQRSIGSISLNEAIPLQELKVTSPEFHGSNLKAAIISEFDANLDFAPAIPTESVIPVFARSVTITEDDVASAKCTISTAPLLLDDDNDSAFDKNVEEMGNFWQTSQGKFKFIIEELPPQEQLFYVFLKEISAHNDADVLYHLLYCLKLMSLHSEVLNKAAKNHRGFLIWCQENLLIPNLWKLLQSEFSQISQLCVPLILHCITLPSGTTMFSKVVEDDFHNNDWRARFAAVERVTTIAHFVEPATVKNSPLLQASLANAFCYLVHCLDDIEASVAQRALLNLEMIKTSSLKLLLWCLEVQFDLVIVDRPMILTTIFQLYNHLSDRRFLTWDFFLNRFDALFLESQINLERIGEINQTRDLRNTNVNSETYQKKLVRAQEALSHTHAARSLSASFGEKLPYKRALSAPTPGLTPKADRDKFCSRQSSAPVMSRKSSKLAALTGSTVTHFPNSFFHDNQIKEVAQEESHLLNVIHKVTEIEDHDKDTIHLLIFLLMQFLSRSDPSHPQDEKTMSRSHLIVLRHLNILMGYSPAEKAFLISPNSLRCLPVFNAFITSMPKVLDFNFKMGNILLSTCLPLLVYCPSPQRYIHDGNHLPVYSLWLLKPHVRQSWLMSLNIILYKHSYNTQSTLKQIQMLIQIVMNTLEAQFHRCRPIHEHMQSPIPSRSRDLSTTSVDLELIHEQELNADQQIEESDGYSQKFNGMSAFSSDAEDEDKELEAILESPQQNITKIVDQQNQIESDLICSEDLTSEPLIQKALTQVVPEAKLEESENLKVKEPIVSKSAFIVSNDTNKDENINKEVIEIKDPVIISEKSFHPPIHRVIRQTSPKLNRLQRMEAIEGSIKLKKSKKDKDSVQKKVEEHETASHNSLVRNASVDEKRLSSQEVVHKVLRNVNSTDSSYTGKADKATKSTWTIEIHSPVKLQSILPVKPPQERLLPIGIGAKDLKISKELSIKEDYGHYIDKVFSGEFDKGVQTFKSLLSNDGEIHYPACERLLPIGPTPPFSRKETPSISPQIQPKRSAIFYADSRIAENTSLSKEDTSESVTDSITTASITSTTASITSSVTTTVATTAPLIATTTMSPIHSIPSKKEQTENQESKAKTSVTPILIGVAKVVKAGQMLETSTVSSKKDIKNKMDINSKLETNTVKEDVIEKPSLEALKQSNETEKPNETHSLSSISTPIATVDEQKPLRQHYRQRKARKIGSTSSELQRSIEGRGGGVADKVSRRVARSIPTKRSSSASASQITANTTHSPEEIIHERCSRCGNVLEQFSEEEIGMCIIILGTYIHRDPSVAAPILPEVLKLVSKYAGFTTFHWQNESNIHLPGSIASIARQFIRCTLHQLSPNGVFKQLFYAHFANPGFFKSIALALSDFVDLNQVSPLVELFQNLNERKHLPHISEMMHMLGNVATYLECISLETPSQQPWGLFLPQLETFLRKLLLLLPDAGVLNLTPLMRIMLSTLKLPIINTCKTVLDPYSKILSHIIQQSPLLYEQLLELCNLCCRSFVRERDRFLLTRTVICELIQSIKFRTLIPDENLMMLVQFILQDAGGTLAPSVIVENLKMNNTFEIENYNTNACECMRQNVMDALEFVTDVHTLSRVKSNFLGTSIHLNEETLGGHLKAGISQYLSLEMTKNNGSDHRAITKYLPWLYSLPSLQQGPKEFIDCVAHIRSLSWLLLGSLQHSALLHNNATFLCQPIPLEANTHIAEHIQVILAGFAEQSKASVLHMSSLFHAFILCQLWTMYCENISGQNPPGSDQYHQCTLTLSDFWAKITPGILQLVCHSKVLAETVSLHFLNLMETLMECNSTMLSRLLPLWTPVFNSYQGQLSGNTQVRLQVVINWQNPPQTKDDAAMISSTMIRWLQRMQTKMSQIEMQSSAAIQFYCI